MRNPARTKLVTEESVSLDQDLTIEGELTVGGNLLLKGTCTVEGDATIGGRCVVPRRLNVAGKLCVGRSLIARQVSAADLTVGGYASLARLQVVGQVDIEAWLDVRTQLEVGGRLQVGQHIGLAGKSWQLTEVVASRLDGVISKDAGHTGAKRWWGRIPGFSAMADPALIRKSWQACRESMPILHDSEAWKDYAWTPLQALAVQLWAEGAAYVESPEHGPRWVRRGNNRSANFGS